MLRNFRQSSVADGSRIILRHQTSGVQASEVSLDQPAGGQTSLPDLADSIRENRLRPLWSARIKWFDKVKGFGFANVR
jgi:CspA family cold shock protein